MSKNRRVLVIQPPNIEDALVLWDLYRDSQKSFNVCSHGSASLHYGTGTYEKRYRFWKFISELYPQTLRGSWHFCTDAALNPCIIEGEDSFDDRKLLVDMGIL